MGRRDYRYCLLPYRFAYYYCVEAKGGVAWEIVRGALSSGAFRGISRGISWGISRGISRGLCGGMVVGLVLAGGRLAPAEAAITLTEQLHAPPTETLREQRDVADQFLLLGKEKSQAGDFPAAITALEAAAGAYHYLGDLVGIEEAYEELVRIYSGLGDYQSATTIVRLQLGLARSNQRYVDQVLALNNLGTLILHSGDLDSAQAAFTEGLTIAQDIGSERGIGLSMSNLGLVAAARGNLNDARKYYEVGANYRARARDYAGQANTDSNLGDVYLASGRLGEAIGAYRLSLSLARDIDDPYIQLRAIDGLIAVYRQRAEPQQLSAYLDERIALTLRTGDDWQRLLTLKTLGEIHEENGHLTEAYESFQRALQIAQALERKTMEAELANRVRALSLRLVR